MRDSTTDRTVETESAGDAIRDGIRAAQELLAYVRLLISATLDRWKLSALMLVLYAALGVFAAAAGVAIVTTSVVLLLVGAAHGLGAALGGREWLGDLIVGFILLAVLTLGITSFLERFMVASRKRTHQKYEAKHQHERQEFGHDVNDRSQSVHSEAIHAN